MYTFLRNSTFIIFIGLFFNSYLVCSFNPDKYKGLRELNPDDDNSKKSSSESDDQKMLAVLVQILRLDGVVANENKSKKPSSESSDLDQERILRGCASSTTMTFEEIEKCKILVNSLREKLNHPQIDKETAHRVHINAFSRCYANHKKGHDFCATVLMSFVSPYIENSSDNNVSKKEIDNSPKITFKDYVGGVPQAIDDLLALIGTKSEYIKKLGIRTPRGILFTGPPGTGKTLLAKALANELPDSAFISASAASFICELVGTGPKAVKELKAKAKSYLAKGFKYVVIFLDEIDSIGTRVNSRSGEASERNNTINELLQLMDGIDSDPRIIIIGATNRPEHLDKALLRAGRFDYIVKIDLPTEEKRLQLLKHYICINPNRQVDKDVDLNKLAEEIEGFNAADVETLINKAYLKAAMSNRLSLCRKDIYETLDEILAQNGRGDYWKNTPLRS